MAIQGRNGKIKGKINNIVYRSYRDKQVLQILPDRVRQTYATKLAALEFGLASIQAKILRRILCNFVGEYDGKMAVRLNAAVLECLRTSQREVGERTLHDADLGGLKGFQFNANAPIERLVKVRPSIDLAPNGQIRIALPRFNVMSDLVYPKEPQRFVPCFFITVAAFNFFEESLHIIDYASFEFTGDNQEAEIDWLCSRQLPKGSMVFITLALSYVHTNWVGQRQVTKDSAFSPSIILDAFHVTDAMASKGAEDGLETPKEAMPCDDIFTRKLREIAYFKKKYAKNAR
ncbi:hypothetical protein SAMN05421747_105110 [Parapedobacter composti]|uniref:Uncharacterized protein n=1 Tax=Parapedobacter composti TaxID=623281 RepID=A0A1I1GVD1_9SPHI|nr:hypothetical protein [Parapedobacter composti]SFC15624.1 hypothetical protein SAMN05421747_105110 [Parapedobacter composti]